MLSVCRFLVWAREDVINGVSYGYSALWCVKHPELFTLDSGSDESEAKNASIAIYFVSLFFFLLKASTEIINIIIIIFYLFFI